MKNYLLKPLIVAALFASPMLVASAFSVQRTACGFKIPANGLPPNAADWPYDTLSVKVSRYNAPDAIRSLASNTPVNGPAANELITSLSAELKAHADPNYAPPARLYHLESVDLRDDVIASTRWILEDRSLASWTAPDQYILRAWVESVNATGIKPQDPENINYGGGYKVVPDSFATDTDWARWRNRRASHVRNYEAK